MKKAIQLFTVPTIVILLFSACNKEKSQTQKPDPTYPDKQLRLESAFGWVSLPPLATPGHIQYFIFKRDSTFLLHEVRSNRSETKDSGNYSVNMNQISLLSRKYFYQDDKDNWQFEVKDKQLYGNCTYDIRKDTLFLKFKLPETGNLVIRSFKAYLPPG